MACGLYPRSLPRIDSSFKSRGSRRRASIIVRCDDSGTGTAVSQLSRQEPQWRYVSSKVLLTEDNHKLSNFVEEPKVSNLLATKGDAIDVTILSSILGRTPPTKETIAEACQKLYDPQ
jgi:hypothetical protein